MPKWLGSLWITIFWVCSLKRESPTSSTISKTAISTPKLSHFNGSVAFSLTTLASTSSQESGTCSSSKALRYCLEFVWQYYTWWNPKSWATKTSKTSWKYSIAFPLIYRMPTASSKSPICQSTKSKIKKLKHSEKSLRKVHIKISSKGINPLKDMAVVLQVNSGPTFWTSFLCTLVFRSRQWLINFLICIFTSKVTSSTTWLAITHGPFAFLIFPSIKDSLSFLYIESRIFQAILMRDTFTATSKKTMNPKSSIWTKQSRNQALNPCNFSPKLIVSLIKIKTLTK